MDFLSPLEMEALRISLRVAGWSLLVGLPLALLSAWLLVRTNFPGQMIFNSIIHLPLILPPVVVGYLLLLLLGRKGPLGSFLYESFGITLPFSWQGAALAAGIMAFPLMVRSMRLSLQNVDRGLEEAPRTLGASRAKVIATITLPLMAPGIVMGAILGFARCLGEFGATITFAANIPGETRTLPIAIFSAVQSPGGEEAAYRLVAISVFVSLGALAASEYLNKKLQKRITG